MPRRIDPDLRARVVELLREGGHSYRQIVADVAPIGRIAPGTISQIAKAEGLRPSDDTETMARVRVAADTNRTRTASRRAEESARMVGHLTDLHELWSTLVQEGAPTPRELTELARAMSSMAKAHADLEAVERASRAVEGASDARSMIGNLLEGLANLGNV